MQISNVAKRLLKVLSVFVLLAATAIGLFLGKDLYPTLVDSHLKTATQLPTESTNPQPLIVLEEVGPCSFSNLYLSLPPKCKTADGSFVPAEGTSPYLIRIPEPK
jgi:hypothetical protein